MGKKDPRVDAYIEKAAPFARPVLERLRAAIHSGCPDVTETIKWSVPAFDYKGPLAGMAAFKAHCRFILWKSALVFEGEAVAAKRLHKITAAGELPSHAVLVRLVRKATALNDQGTKAPRAAAAGAARKSPPRMPPALAAALKKNSRALAAYEAFSPSHKREYVEWIAGARQEATRQRRLATAIEWIAAGKSRNWKYQ
jgi:hypothetical protein